MAPQLLGLSPDTENTAKPHDPDMENTAKPQDSDKENTVKAKQGESPTKSLQPETKSKVRRALEPVVLQKTTVVKRKKQRKTMQKSPVYLCGTCGCDCLDIPLGEDDQSVNCDKCDVWVHYVCAGVTDKVLETVDVWHCHKCK